MGIQLKCWTLINATKFQGKLMTLPLQPLLKVADRKILLAVPLVHSFLRPHLRKGIIVEMATISNDNSSICIHARKRYLRSSRRPTQPTKWRTAYRVNLATCSSVNTADSAAKKKNHCDTFTSHVSEICRKIEKSQKQIIKKLTWIRIKIQTQKQKQKQEIVERANNNTYLRYIRPEKR